MYCVLKTYYKFNILSVVVSEFSRSWLARQWFHLGFIVFNDQILLFVFITLIGTIKEQINGMRVLPKPDNDTCGRYIILAFVQFNDSS